MREEYQWRKGGERETENAKKVADIYHRKAKATLDEKTTKHQPKKKPLEFYDSADINV